MGKEVYIPRGTTFLYDEFAPFQWDQLVQVGAYYIDESLVTYAEYGEFLSRTGGLFRKGVWELRGGLFRKAGYVP